MSGLFGVVSKTDCVETLFYGTDYHSHLGTQKAGLAVMNRRIYRSIHDISTSQFKSKFIDELPKMKGTIGIGVISDLDPQPIIVSSSFGHFALVTSGLVGNRETLVKGIMNNGGSFSEMSGGRINETELIGKMIAHKKSIAEGIEYAFSKIKGSISLLALTKEGIYAARDPLGRTVLVIGQKGESLAVASETCAFPNLGFEPVRQLAPGEIILLSKSGLKQENGFLSKGKVCSFLWIYTGYPASCYEGISVEAARERCGINLAKNDRNKADFVAGVPDSGTAHAIGYAIGAGIPYRRPLVKYTDGYGRSYTPPSQKIRDRVAQMKLVSIKQIIKGQKIVVCDDSIVRGTQLKNQAIQKLWHDGAKEIHVRIACPPLMFPCKYILSTRSRNELASKRAINKIFGSKKKVDIKKFLNENTLEYKKMVEYIRKELDVTSLKYQSIKDMVEAIGLPREKLCLHCWNGED